MRWWWVIGALAACGGGGDCTDDGSGPGQAARLVQVGRGWFSTRRTGLAWDGALGSALNAEPGLLAALDPEIGPDDGLTLKAEVDLVRIVLARTIVTAFGLAAGPALARVDRPSLGPGLLTAIEHIAAVALR